MTNKDIKTLEALVAVGAKAEVAWVSKAPLNVREDAFYNYDLLARKAHPSLKALLDHVKEQERVMQVMAYHFRNVIDDIPMEYDNHGNPIDKEFDDKIEAAEQVLAQFENMKKEK